MQDCDMYIYRQWNLDGWNLMRNQRAKKIHSLLRSVGLCQGLRRKGSSVNVFSLYDHTS